MTEPKFTPGPWKEFRGQIQPSRRANGGFVICDCDAFPGPDARFNIRLIAAAPELYEALAACFAALGPMGPTKESVVAYQAAETALAKARGGEQP